MSTYHVHLNLKSETFKKMHLLLFSDKFAEKLEIEFAGCFQLKHIFTRDSTENEGKQNIKEPRQPELPLPNINPGTVLGKQFQKSLCTVKQQYVRMRTAIPSISISQHVQKHAVEKAPCFVDPIKISINTSML